MGTKAHPGVYDCYAKAADDEPLFVLRAKDPLAPQLVEAWADRAELEGVELAKIQEARVCADDMREWASVNLDDHKG